MKGIFCNMNTYRKKHKRRRTSSKNGHPKLSSRFICVKCLQLNNVGAGIQRGSQREKGHIKDLYCINCREVTKNQEIRYCDEYSEILEMAINNQLIYYPTKQKS